MREPIVKNIGIETTTICNARCVVCPRTNLFDGHITTMSMELFEKVVLDLYDNCFPRFLIFGGMGDASCDKKLIERLRFCRENTPEMNLVVASNMAVWKPEYSRIIVEEQLLDVLRASIFAVSDEASDQAYGKPGQGQIACERMKHFVECNEASGHPVQTGLYTLHSKGFEDEVDILKSWFWDSVDEFEAWLPHNWSNLFPDLRETQDQRRTCDRVEDFEIMIRVNGDVCACSMDVNASIVYGSLARQTITEIRESEAYTQFRELNRAGGIESCPTCKGCSFLNADESSVLVEAKPLSEDFQNRPSYFQRNALAN